MPQIQEEDGRSTYGSMIESASTHDASIRIRPMEEKDVNAVSALDRLVFTLPWSYESFMHELKHNPLARYYVLDAGGSVIGYAGMWLVFDEAHVTNIAVHPEKRGRGWGEKLLRYLMAVARDCGASKMSLEVRVSNTIALRLYKKLGFTISGRRKGYYQDNGEDAYVMWAPLNDEGAVHDGCEEVE